MLKRELVQDTSPAVSPSKLGAGLTWKQAAYYGYSPQAVRRMQRDQLQEEI